jgi:hypothetical protein
VAALAIALLLATCCLIGSARNVTLPLIRQPPESRRVQPASRLPMMVYATNQVGDRTRNRRINLVIGGCLNAFSPSVLDSRREYLACFGEALPAVDAQPSTLSLADASSDPERCESALRAAGAIDPPDSALVSAGRDYLAALRVTTTLLRTAHRYYRNHDWSDDGMARGRAMHPLLLQRFAEFEQAHTALARLVEDAQRESPAPPCTATTLELSARCDLARHQILARAATVSASRTRLSAGGSVAGVDLPRLAAQVGALETSVRGLSDLGIRLPAGAAPELVLVFYVGAAEEHLRELKSLYRTVRDHTLVDGEQWTTLHLEPAGAPPRIISAVNNTVGQFNDL